MMKTKEKVFDEYLSEIAKRLGCHRAFILETIDHMQEELLDLHDDVDRLNKKWEDHVCM